MSVSRPGRIVLAAAAVLALGVCAAPGAAQFGEAAAAQYAGQPASHWQNLLAQHLDKETDEDKEECRRAAQALGQIGPPAQAAIPLLVRALQSPAVEVRGFAVDALGRIGQQPESVVPAIVAEADLPPAHINYAPLAPFRCLAARALGRLGPKAVAAVPMLERALQNEDPLYRVQAAWALWEIAQHPQALPTLRAVLKQTDSEAAFGAALALAQLDDAAPSAAADLIEALDHPDADVRRAAASALVALGGSDWETVAARLLQGEFRAPAAAAYVLGQFLDRQRQTVFYAPELDAQQLAAAARPAVRAAAPALVRLLEDPDPEVRQTAVQSLARMGLLAAPFLLPRLDSANVAVCAAASDALTRMEDYLPETTTPNAGMALIMTRLIPPLLALMEHASPDVRRAAYRAFAKISWGAEARAAEPLLRKALRDQDLAIRRFAFEALQQLGEP